MLAAIVRAMLKQRLLVVVVALGLCAAGVLAAKNLTVDAFPDVTNIQVQVATVAVGRSPEEVERLITVPVEIAMTGLPGLVEMRSLNKSGLSLITLVFTDQTDVFFARQLVMERLIEVSSRLLPGITPVLGPVSTGLGEVYQYTIEHPDDGKRALTVRGIDGTAHDPGLGGATHAALDPGRSGNQFHRRACQGVPGSGRPQPVAPLRLDACRCRPRPRQQQRQCQRQHPATAFTNNT